MPHTFKIATYNIFQGRDVKNISLNITRLKHLGVKIICLQELRQNLGGKFLLDELLKKLGPNWQAEFFIRMPSNDLGLCIIWDSSFITARGFEKILLPKLRPLKIIETVLKKVPIKNTTPGQRKALIGDFNINGKPLRIINVHLDWQGGGSHKKAQINALNYFLEACPQIDREILCGDFNTLGFYGLHKQRIKKINKLVGGNYKPSQQKKSTFRYWQTLDHILAKNIDIVKTEVIKLKGSDHYPLIAEINI